MTSPTDCRQNRDALKLVREGTGQEQRLVPALDPAYAPVDGRSVAHGMLFAQAFSAFLKYFNLDNVEDGVWRPFFSRDVSVQLAVAAVQDVEYYKSQVKGFFDFLRDLDAGSDETEAKKNLGYLFSSAGTLAAQLDLLKEGLPPDIQLKPVLRNLIAGSLAPALRRLIAYYKADLAILPESDRLIADVEPGLVILASPTVPFSAVYQAGLSKEWITDGSADWISYTAAVPADASVFGSGLGVNSRINHIATHNLFTSVFDQLLMAYARTVSEGSRALEATLTQRDDHEPHYALFLAFLRLFAYARTEMNTLTGRHLDFYYREVLRLKEKSAQPGHAHLLVELAKHAPTHLLVRGELFKAGKDGLGKDAFYAGDRDFVANQAQVAALKNMYRHGNEKVGADAPSDLQQGRIFTSPVADSADGYHPFHNKAFKDGVLDKIAMPRAELGFAIASHQLFLAQGERTVTALFKLQAPLAGNFKNGVVCSFTTGKGWLDKTPSSCAGDGNILLLQVRLEGSDPAVVPYLPETHGYTFTTDLPVMLVRLKQQENAKYPYPALEAVQVASIDLTVDVKQLKLAALSNDFGPVDPSKPFQPFGAGPVKNGSFVIGSKELFQKNLTGATANVKWQSAPAPFGGKSVNAMTEYLQGGVWRPYPANVQTAVTGTSFPLLGENPSPGAAPFVDAPDATENEHYQAAARSGFVRLRLDNDFGQSEYEQALIDYIKRVTNEDPDDDGTKPIPPAGPFATELTLDYAAKQTIALNAANKEGFEARQARFFHLAPFGAAEQHPYLKPSEDFTDPAIYLLPQLKHVNRDDAKLPQKQPVPHEAELYLGVTDLKPPQNLALLFQVADGTADPLSTKPKPHLNWSYLRGNEWIPFAKDGVEDGTGELLKSGIITFSVPRDAADDNTLLPAGMHWIRGAVAEKSDSVCRLVAVAAQALPATFADRDNDPGFPAKELPPGTITKLDTPDADVKKISQPFAGFGGRGKEAPTAFYTRISERLRHKDRAIAQWDYERLVLEAFPQVYRAKCLNHTQYEPDETGTGIYRELAPGHVTIVTVPNQQSHNVRDPFRPYTSLGVLDEIDAFLRRRLSCFVTLHVKNPQFEEVQVRCKVRFHKGVDESFHLAKVKEAVTRFLSPWAFPGGGSPTFGGRILKSVLIDFVEELPYVDCVTDFRLFHTFDDDNGVRRTVEGDEVAGSKGVSILVSARKHVVDAINPAEEAAPWERCRCEA